MNYKKILMLLTSLTLLTGCSGAEETVTDPKPVDGIAPLFNEGLSFYNTDPSIIDVSETERYVFYAVNETKKSFDTSIAVRKGELKDGVYVYGKKHTVLKKGAEGSFDSFRVTAPDVVKGDFKLDGTNYNYLMAYQGNDDNKENCFNIGFAVSNDLTSNWVKVGNNPIVNFDEEEFGEGWGVGQPSLLSYDTHGKIMLYYTIGEKYSTATYVSQLDCSDLNNIIGLESRSILPTRGLIENQDIITLNDVDLSLDENDDLYIVRNVNPASAVAPTTYKAIQVARMPFANLYNVNARWSVVEEKINMLDLEDGDLPGWERVYNGCFVSNPYGKIASSDVNVGMTVTSWDDDTKEYKFYQTIVIYNLGDVNA